MLFIVLMNNTTIEVRPCNVNGCVKPRHTGRKGMCHMHYMRDWLHGDVGDCRSGRFQVSLDKPNEAREYLLQFRVVEGDCWVWQRGRNTKGYGKVWMNDKYRSVSRVAAHLWSGFDLDSELHILHHCDNPPCFNPEHLFAGTNADNVIDKCLKGRQPSNAGEKHPSARLKEEDVRNIRRLHATGETYKSIAKTCGMSYQQVRQIVLRLSWKHI